MKKGTLVIVLIVLLILLGIYMIYLGMKASILPPVITGIGFGVIALIFLVTGLKK